MTSTLKELFVLFAVVHRWNPAAVQALETAFGVSQLTDCPSRMISEEAYWKMNAISMNIYEVIKKQQ